MNHNQPNPYDFITNAPTKPKKSLLPGGNSKTGRLILVGVAGVVLLLLFVIVVSLLSSGSAATRADYSTLMQQQTELVRIIDTGLSKARLPDTKNLAITTKLTLSSQQSALLAAAKNAGASTDPKSLAAGKDTKTDQTLESAEQTNQFDEVFTAQLVEHLQAYQKQLKKLYDATEDNPTKAKLSGSYSAVEDLLSNITPATES